jgi:hypothetical protein
MREDEPGVIAEILPSVSDLNIALAESVTLETGKMHHTTLICEGPQNASARVYQLPLKLKLEQQGFQKVRVDAFESLPLPVQYHDIAVVDHGWVRGLNLRREIEKTYPPNTLAQVDLTKAVVSADTERRLLRFVFPKRGAMTVKIKHADKAGVLAKLARALLDCDLNVLSALLRRGGQEQDNAELVAVCEPAEGMDLARIEKTIEERISRLPQEDRVRLSPINKEGRRAEDVISLIEQPRRVPGQLCPIFVSTRFFDPDQVRATLEVIQRVLNRHGYIAVLPTPCVTAGSPMDQHVSPRMWMSEAGIILVGGSRSEPGYLLEMAHEFGYLQAQGKPMLLLGEAIKDGPITGWCKQNDITVGSYTVSADGISSLDDVLSHWLKNLTRWLTRP